MLHKTPYGLRCPKMRGLKPLPCTVPVWDPVKKESLNEATEHWGIGECMIQTGTFYIHVPLAVVMELVVAAKRDESAEANAQREKDLRCRVDPNLTRNSTTTITQTTRITRDAQQAKDLRCRVDPNLTSNKINNNNNNKTTRTTRDAHPEALAANDVARLTSTRVNMKKKRYFPRGVLYSQS